ncbi:MAG: hypothetical protein JO157_04460 [Acetobacteraceae bacterium]|nr:hypothetical protein [Acetobacteraceae bacterium]
MDLLCTAWNALRAETGRLTTLTSFPWTVRALDQVNSRVNGYQWPRPWLAVGVRDESPARPHDRAIAAAA